MNDKASQLVAPKAEHKPHFMTRMNANGKALGQRVIFSGTQSAAELRKELKAKGKKGKELSEAVNAVLRGDVDVRVIVGQAFIAGMVQGGWVPDVCDINKKETTAKMTFLKVEALKVDPKDLARMKSEDKDALLKALLAEKEAAKAEDKTLEAELAGQPAAAQ